MPLARLFTQFQDTLAFSQHIITDAHQVRADGMFIHDENFRVFITEAAVVRIHIAWERFLEQTFLQYLMGVPSAVGTAVVGYLRPSSIEHANSMIIGTQRYLDWSDPAIVLRVANLYLENGEPYRTAMASIQQYLTDLRLIRNACAHSSTTAIDKLPGVATRRLGNASAGATAYALVLAADPAALNQTLLQSLVAYLTAAARQISSA